MHCSDAGVSREQQWKGEDRERRQSNVRVTETIILMSFPLQHVTDKLDTVSSSPVHFSLWDLTRGDNKAMLSATLCHHCYVSNYCLKCLTEPGSKCD